MTDEHAVPSTPPPSTSAEGLRQRHLGLSSAQKAKVRLDRAVAVAAASQPPPMATALIQRAEPVLRFAGDLLLRVGPIYVEGARLVAAAYRSLPIDILHALTGLALCFFGGAYCASIAAIEAFVQIGWSTTQGALEDVYEDVKLIWLAHEEDEKQTKDGDGAEGASFSIVSQRKLRVAALAVRDPEKLSTALGGLYAGWIAVQGTLRLEFARTITLGVSIAEMLDAPALRYGLPVLTHVVPADLHRWLPTAIRSASKAIAVFVAWYLHVAIAAFQSALRGGLMCSRALLRWANKRGLADVDPEETRMDEFLGYFLCVLGFYTQFCWGFSLPFPFNILLLPFTIVEWYIRWSVTT